MKKRSLFSALLLVACTAVSAPAEEPKSPGALWQEMSVKEKALFMEGHQAGYIFGVMHATKFFMPTESKEEQEKAFNKATMIFADRQFGRDMVAAILVTMDKLYQDPDNSDIDKSYLLEMAIDKVRGRDITDLLGQHRQEAKKILAEEKAETKGQDKTQDGKEAEKK